MGSSCLESVNAEIGQVRDKEKVAVQGVAFFDHRVAMSNISTEYERQNGATVASEQQPAASRESISPCS